MTAPFDLDDLLEGIHERFLTVDPFTAKRLIAGEPTSIQEPPIIYSMLADTKIEEIGNMVAWHIRFMCRACVLLQDRIVSEATIRRLAVELPVSIMLDDRLDNRISSGRALADKGIAGFVRINETNFRMVDVYVTVEYKHPRLDG